LTVSPRLPIAAAKPVGSHARIYGVVRRIPRGRVATYGQIAALAGLRGQARLVGYAMHALPPGSVVPWQRVINARGMVSVRRGDSGGALTQRLLLEREGVRFDQRGRVALERYRWQPAGRKRPTGVSPRKTTRPR
jgi:methylated-DNA-protein-cysteine methyltransferase-like protein